MPTTLPENLDWSAEYLIPTPNNANDLSALRPSWISALLYDTDDVREFVVNGGLYHQRVSEQFLIAYSFRFDINAAGHVVAHGATYPAIQRGDDYHTDESEVLCEVDITIHQHHPDTALALRRYVREHHMRQLPDTRHGFPQPANGRCENCIRQQHGSGAMPVLHCPSCDHSFCPNCAHIAHWSDTEPHACPHCDQTPHADAA